jgi:hypothetical protein
MTSLFVRLLLPFHPLGLRLLVLALSIGWLTTTLGSVLFLGGIVWLPGAPATPALSWLTVSAVLLLATSGHAALVRSHRWTGLLLLLGACGLGTVLLYYALMIFSLMAVIYGG